MFQQVPTKSSINLLKNSNISELIIYYRRLKIKFKTLTNHLWFNSTCLKLNIFPNYIHRSLKCSISNKTSRKVIYLAKLKWLKEEIHSQYQKRDNVSIHLKVIHTELASRLHPVEFDTVWKQIQEDASIISHKQYLRQSNKLHRLTIHQTQHLRVSSSQSQHQQQRDNKQKFFPRYVNLSTTTLTSGEAAVLNKGLKYAPTTTTQTKDKVNLAVHLDAAVDDENLNAKLELSKIVHKHIDKKLNHTERIELNNILSLRRKLQDNNLIVSKADKGNTVVILDKSTYIEKVEICLNSMNLNTLNNDPTKKFNNEIIKSLNNSKDIINQNDKYQLRVSNPSIPILYGLVKLHKQGNPIRPVSSSCRAPAQRLSKFLSTLLPNMIQFKSKHAVINSYDLIDKVKNLRLPFNAKLVSFDVCNLFPSVPVEKLKNILFKDIRQKIASDKAEQLINLTKTCLNQNYFTFNNKIYEQTNGLAMGNPASPFFAEYFMAHIEENLFKSSHPTTKYINSWFRYVDDILCIWTGSTRQLQNFLNNVLNKLEDGIKFTVEIGNNNINFLDLKLMIVNNKLNFNIYRKDTFSDNVIPFSSNHPWNIKMAAFYSMLHRLLTVPLSKVNFNTELQTIMEIAINNGYKKTHIYKLLAKKSTQEAIKLIYPVPKNQDDGRRWAKIPFIQKTDQQIKEVLATINTRPAFFNTKTLQNLICNHKIQQNVDDVEKSGIYKIKCADCSGVYIGKTKRSLKVRFSEHIAGARSNRPLSGLSKHLKDNNHKTELKNAKLVHNLNGGKILDKFEAFEIRKAKHIGINLVNDQVDFTNTSPLIDPKHFVEHR